MSDAENSNQALPAVSTVPVETFFSCELRAGTITACVLNAKARKAAYVLTIDFGVAGVRTSSGQFTRLYQPEHLIGRQIVGVLNFPPRNIAGIESQCLVLGFDTPEGVVLLTPERSVANGERVF
ncbi:MAG: tRNA-binding protein [Chloroflexi bacterium]|nr:tRNA-binding protein [Chloroflexota bacterium]